MLNIYSNNQRTKDKIFNLTREIDFPYFINAEELQKTCDPKTLHLYNLSVQFLVTILDYDKEKHKNRKEMMMFHKNIIEAELMKNFSEFKEEGGEGATGIRKLGISLYPLQSITAEKIFLALDIKDFNQLHNIQLRDCFKLTFTKNNTIIT